MSNELAPYRQPGEQPTQPEPPPPSHRQIVSWYRGRVLLIQLGLHLVAAVLGFLIWLVCILMGIGLSATGTTKLILVLFIAWLLFWPRFRLFELIELRLELGKGTHPHELANEGLVLLDRLWQAWPVHSSQPLTERRRSTWLLD